MNNNPTRKQILKQLEGCEITNQNITNEITELQERLMRKLEKEDFLDRSVLYFSLYFLIQ